MNHAPAPWGVQQQESWPFNIRIIAADGNEILDWPLTAHTSKDKTIEDALTAKHWRPQDRQRIVDAIAAQLANARLIAAAPELLAALEGVVDEIAFDAINGHGLFSTAQLDAARAAIAKAKGETS